MRAVTLAGSGGVEVLQIGRREDPQPGAGEVVVRVRAFGINRADLLQRRGLYPAPPGVPADIPGLEFAGEVERPASPTGGSGSLLGPAPRDGDRVMGIVAGGAYAERLVVAAEHLLPIPEGLSFTEAAAIPEAFLTAHDALERLELAAGQWLLVRAVGSGVGTAAVQVARARGARTVGTSRTRRKLQGAAALGMDAGIDTSREDLVEAVRRVTDGGVHAVLDLVGGAGLAAALRTLRPQGRLVLVGLTGGREATLDLGWLLRQRLHVEGTVLRSRSREEKAALVLGFATTALPLFSEGRLRPVVDRVLSFGEVAQAHEILEANASFGKVVVCVDDEGP